MPSLIGVTLWPSMTVTAPYRRWRLLRVRRASDKRISDLRAALDRLGYVWWPVPLSVRAAIRQVCGTSPGALLYMEAVWLGVTTLALSMYLDLTTNTSPKSATAFIGLLVWTLTLAFTAGVTRQAYVVANRCRIVTDCTEVIKACAETHGAGGNRRTVQLRALSTSLRRLERCILRAYRARGTVPHFSPMRGDLRRHGGQVVARLRATECRLTGEEQAHALEELAGLIITIAELYTRGSVGALLPPSSLEEFEPVRDWELLRVGTTVSLIAGAAVGVSVLGLPGVAATAIISAVGVLTLLVLFGRSWRRYLPVVEFIKSGP